MNPACFTHHMYPSTGSRSGALHETLPTPAYLIMRSRSPLRSHIPSREARLRISMTFQSKYVGRTKQIVGLPIEHELVYAHRFQKTGFRFPSKCKDISPMERVVLLSDGSLTLTMEALAGEKAHVTVIEQRSVHEDSWDAPLLSRQAGSDSSNNGPNQISDHAGLMQDVLSLLQVPESKELLRRQVWLSVSPNEQLIGTKYPRIEKFIQDRAVTPGSHIAAYACSWWRVDDAGAILKDISQPIWKSLESEKAEFRRDLKSIYSVRMAAIESKFGLPANSSLKIWARHYIFWRGGMPLAVIFEALNPLFFSEVSWSR